MKILFVSPYPPSLIRTRTHNFIKHLARKEHDVDVLYLHDERESGFGVSRLKLTSPRVHLHKINHKRFSSLINIVKAYPQGIPSICAYTSSNIMKKTIENFIRKNTYDCIHIESLRAGQFISQNLISAQKIILDNVDCMSLLYDQIARAHPSPIMKVAYGIEASKLRKYEPEELSRFPTVIISSDRDKKSLESLSVKTNLRIITNGVDLEYFSPSLNQIDPFSLVFSGKMSYVANNIAAVTFARKILPLVWKSFPRVKFYVVGMKPSRELLKFHDGHRIIVTGFVKNMANYLAKAFIDVVPLFVGTGIQNKVLEAMAMAKPVVSTSLGIEPFKVISGKDVMVAETFNEFAEHIIWLLKNPFQARKIGIAARKYVEQNHQWKDKALQLEEVYSQIIA